MFYLGIDPGQRGGFAYVTDDGCKETFPWDDINFITRIEYIKLTGHDIIACVERVNAMPQQGVTSMFTFGKSAGYIEGVLSAFHIPYQTILPKRWKHEYSLNGDKNNSIICCQKLFPDVNLLRTPKCIKPSDGMAEALLIAEYGRRLYKRGGTK